MKHLRGRMLVITAIVLGLLYIGFRINSKRLDMISLHDQTLKEAITTVAVIHPMPRPATETITLPGNLVGWYEAPIYARVSGYVAMWYQDYGAKVEKGQVLAKINTPGLDAEFLQAQADLQAERARNALAQLTAKRYVAMRQNQALSEQAISVKLAEAQAEMATVAAAEQKVKNIEAFIGFKKIVAPFDGVIVQRNINVGDLVSKEGTLSTPNAATNLYTVAMVDKLRLFVNVPEQFGPFLQPGLTADVTVPQIPHRHFTADFLTVSLGFDLRTRTAVTIFTIDNKDRALWPGSYAKVQLTAPVDRQTFTIPSTALIFQEHGTQVAVVTDDTHVHLKPIIVSKLMDKTVEVEEGLSAQDRVVNNPSAALREDATVRIVTPEPGYDLITNDMPAGHEQSSE